MSQCQYELLYDPLRIYPEDKFSPHFGLDYDDDVAMVIQDMKIIKGYRDYSFPLEEIETGEPRSR